MNAKQRNGMTKSILLNLKRLVLGGGKMIAALLICAAIQAYAIEFTATGVVQKIFALDKIVYGVDKSHILIGGLSVAGTCPTNDGLIALALRDDDGGRRQLSVALAAKLTNRPVVIRVEDLSKNGSGHCYLKYLELNSSLPCWLHFMENLSGWNFVVETVNLICKPNPWRE